MTLWKSWMGSWLLVIPVSCCSLNAQPSPELSFVLKDQKIFRDIKNPNLYYFMPFDYKLVKAADGKPSFSLTQMRYTGTRKAGDPGVMKYSNMLQFKIASDESQVREVPGLRAALKAKYPAAILQMMPVKKFFSVLVFAPSDGSAGTTDTTAIRNIDMANLTDEQSAVSNSFWSERIVSLRLSDVDAELVETALKKKQSIISFSYAIYSVFADKSPVDVSVTGQGNIKNEVANLFLQQVKPLKDTTHRLALIKADAIDLNVDLGKWPDLVQKIDINERIPARYALFDVYCYDFNNELRPDLYEKRIEIKAISVSGAEIMTSYIFKSSQPDLYAAAIRFMYAVKLDRPFYYRTREINNEGESLYSEWMERKEWNDILDITTPPERRPVKQNTTEQ